MSKEFSSEPFPGRDAAHDVASYAYENKEGIKNVDAENKLKQIWRGSAFSMKV